MRAGDEARPALQASLIIHLDITFVVRCIELCRANMEAVANLTYALAHLVIDDDVGFRVDLEDIQT
jgi:hypothetical protein